MFTHSFKSFTKRQTLLQNIKDFDSSLLSLNENPLTQTLLYDDKRFTEICNTPLLNPFLANVSILYPLKTPENQRFSGVFRGYKMGTLARNGLTQ